MPKIEFDFASMAKATLKEIGTTLVAQGQKNMDKISNGRVYVIGGKNHIASRVGDSPNSMTGDLKASIRYETSGNSLEFGAGDSTVDYAKYLESDRPNVTRSVVQAEDKIRDEVEKLFMNSIRIKR